MAMGKLVRPTELVMPSEAKAAGFPGNNSPGKKKKKKESISKQEGIWEAGKAHKHVHSRGTWGAMTNVAMISPGVKASRFLF